MEPRKDHLVGTQVGEYIIEKRIGLGGMGVVYRATQRRIGKQVAIKVLRAEVMEDPREMERFLDEARAVNAISHRGIINIFGAGELVDGRQYLVMEYLKGEGLDARLHREGRLTAADAIPILEEIVGALGGVHAAGIVHRDLKPGNVFLVEQSDGKVWVKLLDFGLARRGERTDVSRIAGTPDYLSPEHARGLPAGPPSDLYSLGVLAFQLLTGQLPFTGRTPLEVMEKHVYAEAPNPLALEHSIPDALVLLINGLLRKEPAARTQLAEVRALLKQAEKQVRQASTQPGAAELAPQVLEARAAHAAREAAQRGAAPGPGTGGSGAQVASSAETRDALPDFAIAAPATAEAAPRARGPEEQRLEEKERKLRLKIWVGLASLAVAVAFVVGLAFMKPSVQALDVTGSRNAMRVTPEDMTSRPLPANVPRASTELPMLRPADDDEPMPENPAAVAAGAADAGR